MRDRVIGVDLGGTLAEAYDDDGALVARHLVMFTLLASQEAAREREVGV